MPRNERKKKENGKVLGANEPSVRLERQLSARENDGDAGRGNLVAGETRVPAGGKVRVEKKFTEDLCRLY